MGIGHVGHHGIVIKPSRGNECMDRPEFLMASLHHRIHFGRIRYIQRQSQNAPACRIELFGKGRHSRLIEIGQHAVCTAVKKPLGNRPPDAAASARQHQCLR